MMTPEQAAKRRGFITASRIHDVMSRDRNGRPTQAYRDYLFELAVERLGGEVPERNGAALRWGTDVEGAGVLAYEADQGVVVERPGFMVHPTVPYVGATPDWVVPGASLGGESKCPHNSRVHLETVDNGMPAEHDWQVQTGIWVCGCEAWDFVSFDPRVEAALRLFIQRIKRDEARIAEIAKACAELDTLVSETVSYYRGLPASKMRRGL